MTTRGLIVIGLVCLVAPGTLVGQKAEGEGKPRGRQLFYRMVGSRNNAPILPKTRSVWTQDKRVEIGNTGMADEGYTEFPFCYGLMDFTFVEHGPIYPRIISGAQADESRINSADLVIDHVYQPDGCVWGWSAREFVQTFTATSTELVSMTLMVASEPGIFRAALVEGGPGGRQIGPTKTFVSGHSMEWGIARWITGQAPMVPGRTYGIRLWREDGKAWMPYLHSIGNAYDGGVLYVDGLPRPESDLAVWIVEEPADLKRSPVENTDEEGWVYDTDRIWFTPRTPNVRMVSLIVSPILMNPPTEHNCCDLVIRVRSADGKIVAGPKRGLSCGPENGPHAAPFLFAADEFPVAVGERYQIEVYAVAHKAPLPKDDHVVIIRGDMHTTVYGEPQPGALPAIFNLTAATPQDSKLKLTWSQNFPTQTRIEIRGPGMKGAGPDLQHVDVEKGRTEAMIPVWSGHDYEFRLTATGPTGLVWRTPLYRIRMPRANEIEAVLSSPEPYPPCFVNLAPSRVAAGTDPEPLRYRRAVELVNPEFEEGLIGWQVSPPNALDSPDVGVQSRSELKQLGIGTRWGSRMAGFTHMAGEKREQVFAKSTLAQKIATTPGHAYALAAMAFTAVKNGPRGDTRVRLFVDPDGGDNFDGPNSSQWYWTDGKWIRFEHRWIATAEQATIGFGFFRWRDLDAASAYVDHVHVYDLGPAPAAADAPPVRTAERLSLVLIDHKIEADDRVEGFIQAPPGYVITGLGARAHYDNITTMWMKIQPLMPDGSLGEPEELRTGWERDAGLEAQIELPAGYVATGFGAGIAPEWDVKRMGVWARPLNKDGTLGEEKLFRGGVDLQSGFEKQVQLPAGRVLTAAGLNCMLNDVNGIKAASAALIRTAEARAKSSARQ